MKTKRLSLVAACFFLSILGVWAQNGESLKKGSFQVIHIDTVGQYYVFLMKGGLDSKDTLTVLSLINRAPLNKRKYKLQVLRLGGTYNLQLESMRTVRVSSDTTKEVLINLRGFFQGAKMLLKPDILPYRSMNVYKRYYIQPRK